MVSYNELFAAMFNAELLHTDGWERGAVSIVRDATRAMTYRWCLELQNPDTRWRNARAHQLQEHIVAFLSDPRPPVVEPETALSAMRNIVDARGRSLDDAKAALDFSLSMQHRFGRAIVHPGNLAIGTPYEQGVDSFRAQALQRIVPGIVRRIWGEGLYLHNRVVAEVTGAPATIRERFDDALISVPSGWEEVEAEYQAHLQRQKDENEARRAAQVQQAKMVGIGALKVAKGVWNAGASANESMNKAFKMRPQDIEARRIAENQRNRDVFFEMVTRRERQKRNIW